MEIELSLPTRQTSMSNIENSIIHPGIIDHIEPGKIHVRVLAESACASCHAKGYCSMADEKEKMIEVTGENGNSWKNGDEVMVVMEKSAGAKAVILAYVIPLVILVISVITLVNLIGNEGLAALLSLALLAPYYLILFFFRARLRKEFTFRIEALNSDHISA